MKIHELLEARKNPEMNPKISINDEMKRYAAEHPGNCYISFTAIEKLGVNPKSMFGTPIGVYCYPLEYAISKMGDDSSAAVLPYAGGEKFANLFTVSGNVVDLDDIDESDLSKHLVTLTRILPEDIADGIGDIAEEAEDEAVVQTAAGRLWYIVRKCASLLVEHHQKSGQSLTTLFAWIFRKLGFDGLIDRAGEGIIHRNEPTQGVIFNPLVIANVRRVYNRYSRSTADSSKHLGAQVRDMRQRAADLTKSALTTGEKIATAVKTGLLQYLPLAFFDSITPADVHAAYPFEKTIDGAFLRLFSNRIGRRLPKCEDFMIDNTSLSMSYAIFFSKTRFIAGEQTLKQKPKLWAQYIQKFPEAKV